jgi:uncharacterized membrane protein
MVDVAQPEPPEIMAAERSDLTAALKAGWQDLARAPLYGLAFSLVYVLGGWALLATFAAGGQVWWMIPASAGFPILGPFIACGFYEVSRRLEKGEPLVAREVMGVIWSQRSRQIPMMSAMIVVFFLFWNFLIHMIFALFLGTTTLTNITSSPEVFLTPQGLGMIGFGTAIGAVFSVLLFSLTVVSLPLILDREVDFMTAMLTSMRCVRVSPVVMLGWGALIAVALGLGMAVGFLGLFVVLPLFGHASWHLYRRLVV